MAPVPAHTPVLRDELVQLVWPADKHVLVDCTVGLGGHAEAMLQAAGKDALLIALDVDESNLRSAKERLASFSGRVRTFQANFTELPIVLAEVGVTAADVIIADLGLATSQLDDPSRGFSFSAEGPLDMRMDSRLEQTAGDLVNRLCQKPLADLIYQYGQERYSRRIAKAIIQARKQGKIETTCQLARIVERAYPAAARKSRRGVHPATRTFQALRIAVNDELDNLQSLLDQLDQLLAVGGRAAVISFHSLEDRCVKHAFAGLERAQKATVLTKKPITASAEEVQSNPRSRSAKLRGIERTA